MADKQKTVRVRDDAQKVEVYCSRFVGAAYDGTNICVTLGTARLTPSKAGETPLQASEISDPVEIFVTLRFALTPRATLDMVNGLKRMLDNMARRSPPEPEKIN